MSILWRKPGQERAKKKTTEEALHLSLKSLAFLLAVWYNQEKMLKKSKE